jgi:hypothetical protein
VGCQSLDTEIYRGTCIPLDHPPYPPIVNANENEQSGDHKTSHTHVLRATVRDVENKKYVFVVAESEAWKVALGLQRLRKGPLVRSMAVGGMKEGEVGRILGVVSAS